MAIPRLHTQPITHLAIHLMSYPTCRGKKSHLNGPQAHHQPLRSMEIGKEIAMSHLFDAHKPPPPAIDAAN